MWSPLLTSFWRNIFRYSILLQIWIHCKTIFGWQTRPLITFVIADGTCFSRFTLVDAGYNTAVKSAALVDKLLLPPNIRSVDEICLFLIDRGHPTPQQTEVMRLFKRLSDIFRKSNLSSGLTTNVAHRNYTGNVEPVKSHQYRNYFLERGTIQEYITDMLGKQIPQESISHSRLCL